MSDDQKHVQLKLLDDLTQTELSDLANQINKIKGFKFTIATLDHDLDIMGKMQSENISNMYELMFKRKINDSS